VAEETLILAIHVDNCTLMGSSSALITQYKERLNACFPLTDLGPIHWLLGIKITRDRPKTISLSQQLYIDSVLAQFSLQDAQGYSTPMVPSTLYTCSDVPTDTTEDAQMGKVPYREAIGSLMYASVATRPDITFAISTLLQFLENPGQAHWEAVKRVMRYLSQTRNYELTYGGESHDLIGYTNADGASQDHRHVISGYAFLIDGSAISWSSCKQELITLSTAEAEYVAATHTAKEAIWLCKFIFELIPSLSAQTTMFCDNQAVLTVTATVSPVSFSNNGSMEA
jgi:hypothetical protein